MLLQKVDFMFTGYYPSHTDWNLSTPVFFALAPGWFVTSRKSNLRMVNNWIPIPSVGYNFCFCGILVLFLKHVEHIIISNEQE